MDATTRPFERTCPRCGLVFLSQSSDGLCPSCLLTNTLDLEDTEDGPAFWEESDVRPAAERSFSHFDLLDEIGRGGMGVVYRARDLNTERIVAVKVLQAHHLQETDVVKRFRAEVRAEDPAILYLPSGATGEPKMGLVSHAALTSNHMCGFQ